MTRVILFTFLIFLFGCTDFKDKPATKVKSTYVSPSINYKGQFKKGYVRKPVSTNPNAFRNQAKSRYYYETKGKYRRRSTKK